MVSFGIHRQGRDGAIISRLVAGKRRAQSGSKPFAVRRTRRPGSTSSRYWGPRCPMASGRIPWPGHAQRSAVHVLRTVPDRTTALRPARLRGTRRTTRGRSLRDPVLLLTGLARAVTVGIGLYL
jgi:hypothetical protein